jgi:D-glycero-D-manno-heptose 1,7-bisphosphate phosphatase
MRYIDYGLGVLEAHALDAPGDDLAEIYQDLLRRDELAGFEVDQRFYEIGSFAGVAELEAYLKEKSSQPRAVFLDRDGVINRAFLRNGKPHPPATLEQLEILPGTLEALTRLKQRGFLLLVATNQPDVARGAQTREQIEQMHAILAAQLPLDHFLVCYHDDKDDCACRKPKPGLLLQAARDHHIALDQSFLVGDRWRDVDAGNAAGCQTVWIDYGYSERGPSRPAAKTVSSLPDAVDWIVRTA